MFRLIKITKLLSILLIPIILLSQHSVKNIDSNLRNQSWEARWITHPTASTNDYGIFHFRKTFNLNSIPDSFIVHVSADNRYRLFVNGRSVSFGPAKGDLLHWKFESINITKYLDKGKNVLAAEVWNFGEDRPVSQISNQTAFILNGESSSNVHVDTDNSWRVIKNKAYAPISDFSYLNTYIVVGPGEKIKGKKYPWGWQTKNYDSENWKKPKLLEHGTPRGVGSGLNWALVPRKIPLMEESIKRFQKVSRTDSIKIPEGLLTGERSIKIPKNKEVSFLLDQSYLTTAFPYINLSKGKGSKITLTYSESLFTCKGKKGNRDSVNGKIMRGVYDEIYPGGGERREYSTLWFRTYRYLKVEIETGDAPLRIHDIYGKYTAYPFQQKGKFVSSNDALKEIWDIGWRTAKLCAHETYYDCPYYEQLQYTGDTRIQALISLYVSGDDRLMRKAINDFNHSMVSEGLTQSRYPSNDPQFIPSYSLFWISMVHDYWMHRQDRKFIEDKLRNINNIIQWHKKYIDSNDMMKAPPWWNFVDWSKEWTWSRDNYLGGVPKGGNNGYSSILNLQFVYTLNQASEIFRNFGRKHLANEYEKLAQKIKKSVYETCWENKKGLIAETPAEEDFSQHANIMAILSDMFKKERQKKVMKRVIDNDSLIQTTMYYKFYLFRAFDKVDMEKEFFTELKSWYNMVDKGLTTCAEKPDPSRSDCHAWSASPNYEFLATVCGIEPASPGFKEIVIEPTLGKLKNVQGVVPHPKGKIKVELTDSTQRCQAKVILPDSTTGKLIWKDEKHTLKEGKNMFKF